MQRQVIFVVMSAIREKTSALAHDGYIRTRAERSSRAAFEEALASVSVAARWYRI